MGRIAVRKYFSVDDAIRSDVEGSKVFIIANERMTSSGRIGRYYSVFQSFSDFKKCRSKFPHCHEILVDHKNNKPNLAGRLVFDFDIVDVQVPIDFKNQIEDIIFTVADKYFNNIDSNKFEYVWSTSQNAHKFSKHLTVKNLYFDHWVKLSKIFYKLFCIEWDEKYTWILSSKLIDFQIARNNGSLRMVGSSKINGSTLTFDDPNYKLTDSLIRIYTKTDKIDMVTIDNVNKGVFKNIISDDNNNSKIKHHNGVNVKCKIVETKFDDIVYQNAYKLINMVCPNVFTIGKINGNIVCLIRVKSNKCILSGKKHESENAFLTINRGESEYILRFGCYRYCFYQKTVYVGSITCDNYVFMINPKFIRTKKMLNLLNN